MNEQIDPEITHSIETTLGHVGRPSCATYPFVNPPLVRASTVLFEHLADLTSGKAPYVYGRHGTPTSEALASAIAEIEGADGCVLTPSGLSAISTALLAFVSAGDHVLITDSAYGPTREVAEIVLRRLGVEVDYFRPGIGGGIAALMKPRTRVVYTEAPGSLTFEMEDVPALAAAARAHGAVTIMDNTWATPVYFRPLDHGVDVSLMAATKYIVGHSDAMIGTLAAGPRAWPELKRTYAALGLFTGPDDMWLGLRGLRTLAIRLARHQESALKVATWLAGRDDVARVLYPALPDDPGHALWRRDFRGASGLFSIVLAAPHSQEAVAAMLDGLKLFGRGFSWGGFESLVIPSDPSRLRSITAWQAPGPLIRLHIGLEDPDDLIRDLDAGFSRLHRSA
jgi:cystathionine beta-lyase